MRATIKDVSKKTGLSQGTISKYLNEKHVSTKNSEKIRIAIDELGYQVNNMARGLRTASTMTIGILVPDIGNVFSTAIIETVEHLLTLHKYSTIICFHNGNPQQEQEKLEFLLSRQVDGIIIMPSPTSQRHGFPLLGDTVKKGLPVVTFNAAMPNIDCDFVLADNLDATYTAVEECVRMGHQHIGLLVSDPDTLPNAERIEGYKAACAGTGIAFDCNNIAVCHSAGKTASYETTLRLLAQQKDLTAIIATGYRTVLGAKKALTERPTVCENPITLIGFDCGDIAEIITPAISYFEFPAREIATQIVSLLLKRLSPDFNEPPSILRVKTRFVSTN